MPSAYSRFWSVQGVEISLMPIAGLYDVYGLRREIAFEPRFDRRLPGRGIDRTR